MLTGIRRDLVHATQALISARAFTVVCVVSLGIGMALVIAIPYWARVLRLPPPGVNTDGLVEVVTGPGGNRDDITAWSYPDFADLRRADTGVALIGWMGGTSQITRQTAAGPYTELVPTMFVSANYFTTLGVPLARGAGFDRTADDPAAAQPVVIVGYDYWQHDLGGDRDIVGKTIALGAVPHVIVGVAPEHFSGHLGFQERRLFLPLGRYPPLRTDLHLRTDRGNRWMFIAGRLLPGVSIEHASAAVAAATARLARQYRARDDSIAGLVVPYDPLGYRNEFRIVETVAFTLTGAVLLVVCLNISGMMLVRGATRERELSIRHAIGASRWRLAQYLLAEALVLSAAGAALGCAIILNAPAVVSWWMGRPVAFEIQQALRLDPFVLPIGVALCVGAGVLFGWLPASRFSRPVIISSLKDDAGVGGVQAGRVHRWAAALQVGIAVPLLVLCGITLERVRATATADLGFDADLMAAAPLNFGDEAEAATAFRVRSARATLEQASGVAAATVADGLPLDFGTRGARISLPVGPTTAPRIVMAHTTRVGDRYLETMGIPLLVGRGFTGDDRAGAELVTVISKTLADQLLPDAGGDAPREVLGKRLTLATGEHTHDVLTIVGVTRDFPTGQMATPRAQLLLPLAQHPSPKVFLIARSIDSGHATAMTAALENAVRDLGPDVDRTLTSGDGTPFSRIVTGVWLRQKSIGDFLQQSAIAGGAGAVILVLAALGIYGVVGLMVATRTREIAVRAALGASRRAVLAMILLDVVKLVLPGIVIGLLITVAIVRLKGDNLGIRLSDAEPLAYVAGAAVALLVAILASLAHARRAASVQPMVAMRSI